MKEINREAFPGIAFHHLEISDLDFSDIEVADRGERAILHNMTHSAHQAASVNKRSVELKHKVARQLDNFTGKFSDRHEEEAKEIRIVNKKLDEAWREVVDTNRALPNYLRGRHKR